jgi:diguanylate cyclase (GGDEF)-like protein
MRSEAPPGGRVLVVDDDPVIRLLASRCLAAMGLAVEQAEDGRAAIEAVGRSVPHLVLLDVEMPGLDGFETCAELRRRLPARELGVLIATGHTDKATIDRAFEVGATDFVSKPLDWPLLQHRVRFLLRAHEAFAELRDSEKRLENAQRLARIGDWEWAVGEREMLWSAQVYEILGLPQEPGIATLPSYLEVAHPEDRDALEKALQAAATEASGFRIEHRLQLPGGEERIVHQVVEVGLGPDGAVDRLTGTLQDVTTARRAEERIRYLASYDALTALPNRRLLVDHLERSLGHARRRGEALALLCVDLDRFKRFNESLGHDNGDRLLQAAAERMLTCVRSTDFVGRAEPGGPVLSRLGGDEFTVVLRQVRSGEDAAIAARRILESLRAPFAIGLGQVSLGASIGIALYPGDGDDAETLLRNADTAVDAAKRRGGSLYQFFRDAMNERSSRALRIEALLREGIGRGELSLVYQPQLSASSGRVVAVEALARWRSAELGPVGPSEFIPLAEESGLIHEIGLRVLREACRQVAAWRQGGQPVVTVAVNVSVRQLHDPDFARTVEAVLREEGTEPADLELEITESALLVDDAALVEALARLRRLGIRLALDDFGTGYSSLSHVARLPIDVIKIDRSFVAGLGSASRGAAIVAGVVGMGRELGLRVTAEGVETREQQEVLAALGCDVLQGFLVSEPLAADAVPGFLRSRAWTPAGDLERF